LTSASAETLPEPDRRTWLEPDPDDDRGVALLADVLSLVVFDGRTIRRRLWLCYRGARHFRSLRLITSC
jgi:hypothetical protein